MDKLVLTDTGGLPLKLDDILWQDGQLDASNWGVYNAMQAHLLAYGTDFLVEGCVYAAPNITAGWIMLAGELMRVDAQAGTDNYFAKVITFDARGTKTFKDATVNDTYQVNRGVLNAASGSLNITTALRMEDKMIQLLATSTQKFAAANIPQATEIAVGGAEIATTAEATALVNDITMLTPAKLADVNGGILIKFINTGDWDMDGIGKETISIAHGLTYAKIKKVTVIIKNDADTLRYFLIQEGNITWDTTNIILYRDIGGIFDAASFTATSYNRGEVIIEYLI